ncbi:hypothetical protein BU15DRAFT_51412, partial [Melanogaster broomeanus]
TKYVSMLLALDDIPVYWNLYAAFFTWILLAGFVLFPGTLSELQSSGNNVEQEVAGYVAGALDDIAWACTGIGGVGMLWLWWSRRTNYVWVVNRVFIPGLLNSFAGMLSTVSKIFSTRQPSLSLPNKLTLGVTGGIAFVCTVLFLIYYFILLGKLKKEHAKAIEEQLAGKHGKGTERVAKSESTGSIV